MDFLSSMDHVLVIVETWLLAAAMRWLVSPDSHSISLL